MAESRESFWETLLEYIDQRRVIPVVGGELLRLQVNGEVPLTRYLASQLAGRFGVASDGLTPGDPISDVLDRVRARGGNPGDVYFHLNALLKTPLPTPAPLQQLASISHFKLYVTTTYDSLLAQALNEVRFNGERRVKSLVCRLKRYDDLPCELSELQDPIVYHLLGKATPMPDEYAVTEEDTLEFLYGLQSGKPPERLFDELRSQNLLLIGNRFPDWLARFFIRLAKGVRLSQLRGSGEVFADDMTRHDANLALFLNRAGPNKVAIYSEGGAVDFVVELHERYRRRHAETTPTEGSGAMPARAGAVFISYASEDVSAAQTLHESLTAAGVDAWFDKRQLGPGDQWAARIKQGIRDCSLFVPVISANTESRIGPDDYFRREWGWAVGRLIITDLPAGSTFLAPVVIDATDLEAARIPAEFREAQCTLLPGGSATPAFAARLRELQRGFRRANPGQRT